MERELLLLGLLQQHDMHGYQLHEFIDRVMAACLDLKKPTAYFLLDKMAQAGWVDTEVAQEGNRPPRRVYRLTAQGEVEFQRLLRDQLAHYTSPRFESDVALAFVDALPAAEAIELLRHRRVALALALEAARNAPEHQGSVQLIIQHQVHHLTAELDWLDSVITRLAQSQPASRNLKSVIPSTTKRKKQP